MFIADAWITPQNDIICQLKYPLRAIKTTLRHIDLVIFCYIALGHFFIYFCNYLSHKDGIYHYKDIFAELLLFCRLKLSTVME